MAFDGKMIYKRHRYVLTPVAAYEIANVANEYGNEENAKKLLDSISRTIYNYIYKYNHPHNKIYIEYMIHTHDSLKEVIYNAMMSQLEAHVESGVNDIKKQAGFNVETGQVVDKRLLMENTICGEAEDILVNGDGNFNLCYLGRYNHNLTPDDYERLGF